MFKWKEGIWVVGVEQTEVCGDIGRLSWTPWDGCLGSTVEISSQPSLQGLTNRLSTSRLCSNTSCVHMFIFLLFASM